MNRFLPPIVTCLLSEWLRLSSHLVRVIVRLRGLPTPRRPLLVPPTDQVPASSNTRYLLPRPRRNTAHLLARRNTRHLHARTAHLPARLDRNSATVSGGVSVVVVSATAGAALMAWACARGQDAAGEALESSQGFPHRRPAVW